MAILPANISGKDVKALDRILKESIDFAIKMTGDNWDSKNIQFNNIISRVFGNAMTPSLYSHYKSLLNESEIVAIIGNSEIFQVNESARRFIDGGGFTNLKAKQTADHERLLEKEALKEEGLITTIKQNKSTVAANKWGKWSITINILLTIINIVVAILIAREIIN